MDMSQHPTNVVPGTAGQDISLFLAAYGDEGRLASDLAVIWSRAGEVLRLAMTDEAVRLNAALVSSDPTLASRLTAESARQGVEVSLLSLFNAPIDADWLRAAKMTGCDQLETALAPPVLASGLARIIAAGLRRITIDFAEDPSFVELAVNALTQIMAIKLELFSARHNEIVLDEQCRLRAAESAAFRETVGTLLNEALDGSKNLRSRTAGASGSARGMLGKTSEVAAAAEQSAIAMREAAQTAAGLIRAIEDARNEVEVAAGVASRAGEESHRAVEVSQALSEHAHAIESILGLIRDIAGQTNLLALNATIEAARAGDAGRGFAVVAQEVKSLANQTARATDDIAAKIAAIQIATRQTVEANGSSRTTIGEVQASAQRIRTAMETQAQTVTMITAAVDETALAADAMSGTIAAIRKGTETLAGDIDDLDIGFRDMDSRLATLESGAIEFIARVG